jgi:hypothetical protein
LFHMLSVVRVLTDEIGCEVEVCHSMYFLSLIGIPNYTI